MSAAVDVPVIDVEDKAAMINLTYDDKQMLGFEYVQELLSPSSCFGVEKSRRLMPYTREQNKSFCQSLIISSGYVHILISAKKDIGIINRVFNHFKDIRPTLSRGDDYCFNEIELFEIKHFLIQSAQMFEPFERLNVVCHLEGIGFYNTEEALELVRPDHKRIPSFYISETYSKKLRGIRQEKKNIEIAIRQAQTANEKSNLLDERMCIVVREEEEEQRIRKDITVRLRPSLERMLANIKNTANLDLLLQKAKLVRRYGCVKPEIMRTALYFEEMIHPQVAAGLKNGRKELYTGIHRFESWCQCHYGRNMGGKSVALKTTALNTMLVLCGLYPFAKKAGVPILRGISFVAEDKQSIDKGLSSFGAEIVQLDDVVKASKRAFCFIILDEFARGTNPDEGSAIVQAVTKYFNSTNSVVLMTTHYDNVADYAGCHYQVIGLKDVDTKNFERKYHTQPQKRVWILSAKRMNYGIYQVYGKADCPRDALNICRMLALDEDILNIIEKSY